MRREVESQKVNTPQGKQSVNKNDDADFDAAEVYFGDDFPGLFSIDDEDEDFAIEKICWLDPSEFEPAQIS